MLVGVSITETERNLNSSKDSSSSPTKQNLQTISRTTLVVSLLILTSSFIPSPFLTLLLFASFVSLAPIVNVYSKHKVSR